MSSMRKWLKILSFLSIIVGVCIAGHAVVEVFFVPDAWTVALIVSEVLMVVFDFLLGGRGIGAANVPARAVQLMPLALAGIVVSVISLALFVYLDMLWGLPTANLVVMVVFAYLTNRVKQEALR